MKQFLFSIALLAALLTVSSGGPREPASVAASGQASPSAKPRYDVTDLGTLGGASEAFAISENGKVAGMYTPGAYEQAFLWEDGVMQGLGTLGGARSQARGVNDAGQVVGYSLKSSGYNHAFLWQNGAMQDLGTLGGANSMSMAFAINNAGQVVGHSTNAAYKLRAFRWSGGMADLGSLGGDASYGYGINENGQVVGGSFLAPYPDNTFHAFRWGGGMQDLGTGGWDSSTAYGMNDNGQVVGRVALNDNQTWNAILFGGPILGGTQSTAWDINNDGLIVGESGGQAMLWEDGQMKNLNSLIDPASGWTLQSARAINEKGQIVGKGSFNGATRAFMLKPSAYYWVNPNGGAWHTVANWDPQGDPGDGDTVVFDLNGQYSVDVSTLASSNQKLAPNASRVDRVIVASNGFVYLNNMNLNMVSDSPDDQSLQVNDGGTAAVNSGTATFSHAIIGGKPPANPSNPPLARLQVLSSNASLAGTGRLTIGGEGRGELFVTDGGQLTSAESRVGFMMEGVADVGGNGSLWNTGNLAVGYVVSGTMEVKMGGRVNSDSGYVAYGTDSNNSQVLVGGVHPGTGQASMWALLGDLVIGQGAFGYAEAENGGDIYVTQDVRIMNGSLWIVNGNANGDPSDLDVLGNVFIGGSGSRSFLGVTKEAEVDIDGNLMIGQDGVGTFVMLGATGGGPTRLEAVHPLAGLCAIGRTYDGSATVGAYSMLRCQTLELGQAGTGTLGTGTLIVNGGFVRVLDVLRVGSGAAGSGGLGWLEMSWDGKEAVVATNGTYIAPNGGILGDGKLYVGALGLTIDGVLSPGIIVTFPPAPPTAGHESIAQTQDVTGTLIVSGTLTMGPTGRVEIPVTGKNVGQYGSLGVTDAAALDGVIALKFSQGFAPKQGDTFTFLDIGGAVTGAFDSVEISGLEPGFEYQLEVANGQVTLEALNDGVPTGGGCTAKPAKPQLILPKNGKTVKKPKVLLDWNDVTCADTYRVLVRLGSKKGNKMVNENNLATSQHTTKKLTKGQTYYWRASACNAYGCAKSKWQSFKIKP